MRTFYMFKINHEYSKLTKDIPYNLYNTYLSMRLSNKNNLEYIYAQYKSITDNVDSDNLNQRLYQEMKELDGYSIYHNNHMYNNYYSDEVSKLTVYHSHLVLKSNKPNSTFFTMLHDVPDIFVIDFENKDYFWLKTLDNLRLVND